MAVTIKHDGVFKKRLPAAPGAGEHYVPLPDKTENGYVTAHSVQTILVEAQGLYDLWMDVRSFPLWQEHVVSVTPRGPKLSHWVMGDPDDAKGARVEFDSEITDTVRGEKIAWRSVTPGVEQSGTVTFKKHPAGRGTIVTLIQTVKVPGGMLGNLALSTIKRGPKQTVIETLRHFKELAESGAVPSVKGQPHGPRGLAGKAKEWMFGETNPTPPGTSAAA